MWAKQKRSDKTFYQTKSKRLRATTIVIAKLKERFEKLSFAIAIFEGAITIMWAIQERSDQPSLYQS